MRPAKAFLVLLAAQIVTVLPVHAAPYVYVASWRLNYPMPECVDDAYKIARKNQFTKDLDLAKASVTVQTLYASHVSGEFSIAIQCSRDDGTAAYSVSGYDHQDTYDMYLNVNQSFKGL